MGIGKLTWGSATQILSSSGVAGSFVYTTAVSMNASAAGYIGANIQIAYDGSASADNLLIEFYARTSGSFAATDTPIYTQQLDAFSGSPAETFVSLNHVYKWRAGVKRSGSSGTYAVNIKYRPWRVSSA